MSAAADTHPAPDVLQAFGMGNLDDASITKVAEHLDTCVDCQRRVAELSSDSLLDHLRKANGPVGTPPPAKTLAPLASAKPPVPAVPPSDSVPIELRNSTQFEILRELGAGGMGVVYLAKNKLMDRMEVLKVINTAMMRRSGALDRFLREIRAAAALSHDNVVKAYSALQFGELLVFAMEFVEGEDLAKVVKSQGALPIANGCFYVRQVALGLQHAHEKNMVHRDIKPHNLILAREGKKHIVKILDFGLAKATSEKKLDRDLTGEGKMLGTPDYMAPEQIQDAATADIRADIYSLGCTLYYLLAGSTPFSSTSLFGLLQAHQTQNARPLNVIRPEVPLELSAVVAKMMAKDPAKRYQKPMEVAQALLPFIKPAAKGAGAQPATAPAESVKAAPTTAGQVAKRPETMVPTPPPAPPAVPVPAPVMKAAVNEFAFAPEPVVQASTPNKSKKSAPKRFKPAMLAGWVVAVGLLLLGFVVMTSGILRVQTKDGAIVLEDLPPDAEVTVDGVTVSVKLIDGKSFEIRINADKKKHRLEVKRNGIKVFGEEVEVEVEGRRFIQVRMEQNIANATPKNVIDTPAPKIEAGARAPAYKNQLGMAFALVPKGKSWLGGGGGKAGNKEVVIPNDFYLGVYEVTQGEWERLMEYNPSHFSRQGRDREAVKAFSDDELKQFPVEVISWKETQIFLARLNEMDKKPGWIYRLPTELEWEYACRGGPGDDRSASAFDFYFAKPTNVMLPKDNNFGGILGLGLRRTSKVGSFLPNKLGLHDMHGNVVEWCADEIPGDPQDPNSPPKRAIRGGHFWGDHDSCRAAYRFVHDPSFRNPSMGMRVAYVPLDKAAEPKTVPTPLAKTPPPYKNRLGMELALVPKGKGWLGGGFGVRGDQAVEFKEDFYLGVYTVTQEEWEKVTGKNPSFFSRNGPGKNEVKDIPEGDLKRFPVEMVTWDDAQTFLAQLNAREKEAGWIYRLPYEAEWEYACRGGPFCTRLDSGFHFYFAKPTNELLFGQANFGQQPGLKRTCKVGTYAPNPLGFYDMHGNVLEWCNERQSTPDGRAQRMTRGSSWNDSAGRATSRNWFLQTIRYGSIGLRVARVPAGNAGQSMASLTEPAKPKPGPTQGQFVQLFNGTNLAGWTGDTDPKTKRAVWTVKDGILTTEKAANGALRYLGTTYRDFHLRIEAQRSEGEKAAAVIFRSGPSSGWYRSNLAGPNAAPGSLFLGLNAFSGALQSVKTPDVQVAIKSGQWYVHEIVVKGDQITVLVDGRQVLSYTAPVRTVPSMPVYLYVDSGVKVAVRKVEMIELPALIAPKSAIKAGAFAPLFNGNDLAGLSPRQKKSHLPGLFETKSLNHRVTESTEKFNQDNELRRAFSPATTGNRVFGLLLGISRCPL